MRIRVRLPRRAGVAARVLGIQLLVLPVVLASALWAQLRGPAGGTEQLPREAAPPKRYYLTRQVHPAGEARGACAAGYHFASFWEIADPSKMVYDTSRGLLSPDNGSGPPTAINIVGTLRTVGWVRTGYATNASEPPGQANCYTWLTNDSLSWGTAASLPNEWTAGKQDLGVWDVEVRTCSTNLWVWCVQDPYEVVFADGFESGGTSAWSVAAP